MKIKKYILLFLILIMLSGCSLSPYKKSKYGELAISTWFSNSTLGETRKKIENLDEIISKECKYLESRKNKYVFSCKVVYKEKGKTVIPLSKNSNMILYAVFIKEKGNKYDVKVYNSSSKKGVWRLDEYLNY